MFHFLSIDIDFKWQLPQRWHSFRQERSIIPVLSAGLLLALTCSSSPEANAATKVAFIADQGIGSGSKAVLSLIADENVDIVLIQRDLDYDPGAALQWDENITNALGRNFPVLSLVGNHENFEWPLYQRLIEQRMNRATGLSCSGKIGVKANCSFKNLQIVQVATGISGVSGIKPKSRLRWIYPFIIQEQWFTMENMCLAQESTCYAGL